MFNYEALSNPSLKRNHPPVPPSDRPLPSKLVAMKNYLALLLMLISGLVAAADPNWEKLIQLSNEYTEARQQELESRFQFSDYDHWDLDQEKGELVFSKKGAPILIAKFQFVGSYSDTSKTWLWSWANSSILPSLSKDVATVKAYGEKHGFNRLSERKWEATQADGWQMTAVSNYLLKGKGVYRPPFAQGATFVVITEIKAVGAK